MTLIYQAAPMRRYSAQEAAKHAAMTAAYNLCYERSYRWHLGRNATPEQATVCANREATEYMEKTARRCRFITPWFWVSVVLTLVPCLGVPLPILIYWAIWILRRKQTFGIPAPLERVRARVVIR